MTIPLVLVAASAAVAVARTAEPEYSASGAVVLLRTGTVEVEVEVPFVPEVTTPDSVATSEPVVPPADPPDATDQPGLDAVTITIETVPLNPYEQFSASVGVTATLLEEVGNSREFRTQIARAGLDADFSVSLDGEVPILLIEATADRPEIAIATVAGVAEALGRDLDARQNRFEAPETARIITDDVVVPEQAQRIDSARNRAFVALAILSVIVVAGAAMVFDGLARARSRRHAARKLDEDGAIDVDATMAGDAGASTPEPSGPGSQSMDADGWNTSEAMSSDDWWPDDLMLDQTEADVMLEGPRGGSLSEDIEDDSVLEETE